MNNKLTRLGFTALLVFILTLSVVGAVGAQGQSGTTLTTYKTATGHWIRTFQWTIDKSVTPESWNLFRGDSGISEYTIEVTKDGGTDSVYVDGEVCVENGGAVATENLAIGDDILYKTGGGAFQVLTSFQVDTSGNPALDPGESYCYPYSFAFSPVAGAQYKNSARITITNHSGHLGEPFGPSPDAGFTLPANPTLVNNSINVNDTNGSSWQFSDDGSVSYSRTFTCDDDSGEKDNTATIFETGQSDSASVTVNCYELSVTKDANTTFDRTYDWSIDKSADQTNLTLSVGQQYLVNYSVVVDVTGSADSNWAVTGNIAVNNSAPIDANINSVSDLIEGVGAVNVDCGVTFPYVLSAGETLNCTYSSALPDAADRLNTATATLQNYDYDKDGTATANGTTDFSGSANVDFDDAVMTEVDECIDVSDSLYGNLGTVCLDDAPKTFTYSWTVGSYATCGDYTVNNTASFETNDTESTGSDNWSVAVNVPCANGCTLTQGYWKTHSSFGPAPYDDTWALLANGANTPFFFSGKTWYQVLWTPPAGNAYYNLAHQYIAAKLNVLNGADPATVQAALNQATVLFNTYTPAQIASLKGPAGNALRATFINLASTLDRYNNGLIGPGHCSE